MNVPEPADPAIIVGEQLSAVSFVQDYVELHFAGPVLRAFSNPRVQIGRVQYVFPESGSRDALCSLIGLLVVSVSLREADSFVAEFENGSRFVVPLDGSYGESMHFQAERFNSPLSVW